MSDWNEDTQVEERERRRFPDPVNIIVGVLTIGVAAYALTDGEWGLPAVDPRWFIAGVALLIGLLLLGASFRPKRRR
ncbi:MAG TPA: hypothetical protein VHF06_18790 [Pseudonocardiaceae bacterium]|jgi:hypothetical protein|nr:hypothetical protein [Pseudonocardiaceae bacterium]